MLLNMSSRKQKRLIITVRTGVLRPRLSLTQTLALRAQTLQHFNSAQLLKDPIVTRPSTSLANPSSRSTTQMRWETHTRFSVDCRLCALKLRWQIQKSMSFTVWTVQFSGLWFYFINSISRFTGDNQGHMWKISLSFDFKGGVRLIN